MPVIRSGWVLCLVDETYEVIIDILGVIGNTSQFEKLWAYTERVPGYTNRWYWQPVGFDGKPTEHKYYYRAFSSSINLD